MDLITEVNSSLVQRGAYDFTPLLEPIPLSEQSWPKGTVPFVSICCITYNHENFIQEAIDGFLMQKTTFPVEILIHDDASSDKTVNHLKNYSEKYPNLIKLICQVENQYSKGLKPFLFIFKRAKGKYIATCEGDDYWTDSEKLEIQVNFLEKNSTYAGVCHDTLVLELDDFKSHTKVWWQDFGERLDIIFTDTLNFGAAFHTSSFLFRRNLLQLPQDYGSYCSGDMALFSIIASQGSIRRIPKSMSVYRKHSGGITNTSDHKGLNALVNRVLMFCSLKTHLHPQFGSEFSLIINTLKRDIAYFIFKEGKMSNMLFVFRKTNLTFLFSIAIKLVGVYFSMQIFRFKCSIPSELKNTLRLIP